jgi:aspartate racemase
MKKIGLVGGIGPASTLDYYMGVIDGHREKTKAPNYPEIIIYSIDMFEMLSYIEERQWDKAAAQLSGAVNALASAGADFAAIASNTPHLVFDEIKRLSRIPLISIVEETCKFVIEKQYRRVLTIGTLFTMKNGLYSNPLTARGIVSLLPSEKDQQEIYSLFFPNLENGVVVQEDRIKMLALVNRIIGEQSADAVILGCTELPMMIKQGDLSVPVIDTTQVHINSVIRHMG